MRIFYFNHRLAYLKELQAILYIYLVEPKRKRKL